MVMITLYARQQKRHRCIEQSFGLCWGRGMIWGSGMETCIISYKKRITSPGSIQDPWGGYTGMTQRDGTGREVGGGFRMGNTCTPVADSCWCVAEPIQYCKVISLQLNKFKLKKKKRTSREEKLWPPFSSSERYSKIHVVDFNWWYYVLLGLLWWLRW